MVALLWLLSRVPLLANDDDHDRGKSNEDNYERKDTKEMRDIHHDDNDHDHDRI